MFHTQRSQANIPNSVKIILIKRTIKHLYKCKLVRKLP